VRKYDAIKKSLRKIFLEEHFEPKKSKIFISKRRSFSERKSLQRLRRWDDFKFPQRTEIVYERFFFLGFNTSHEIF